MILFCGPQFLIRTQGKICGLFLAKTSLLKKEQKHHFKGKVDQTKRSTSAEMIRKEGFSRQGFIFI